MPEIKRGSIRVYKPDGTARMLDLEGLQLAFPSRACAFGTDFLVASTLDLGFGFPQYFIHPNRRTVHNRIATIVVRDARRAAGVAAE